MEVVVFREIIEKIKRNAEFLELELTEKHWQSEIDPTLTSTEYYVKNRGADILYGRKVAEIYGREKKWVNIENDGRRLLDIMDKYNEFLEMAKELNELWNKVTNDDIIHTHKPFTRDEERIVRLISILNYHNRNFPENFAIKKALSEVGIRFFKRRFYGGDWIFVRIIDGIDGIGIVRVSRKKPSWITGYLIGKRGRRARELGIHVVEV